MVVYREKEYEVDYTIRDINLQKFMRMAFVYPLFISSLLLGLFSLIVFLLIIEPYIISGWWAVFIRLSVVFGITTAITLVVIFIAVVPSKVGNYMRKRREEKAEALKGQDIEPNPVWEWLKSIKTKTCPIIKIKTK